MKYQNAVEYAWRRLVRWYQQGKFKPTCEEDIQCFLYYGLVLCLKDASEVRPKPRVDSPRRPRSGGGPRRAGDMHFPDFSIGSGAQKVVIEIKYARADKGPKPYQGCLRDIEKLKRHHRRAARYFVVFDEHPDHIFLDTHQLRELRNHDEQCNVLYFPRKLNTSIVKGWARKALKTLRARKMNLPTSSHNGT